ncbi:MAG: hypothetical protein Q7S48_02035 [bacterium]|nr:hypothetical protein [bacterium]
MRNLVSLLLLGLALVLGSCNKDRLIEQHSPASVSALATLAPWKTVTLGTHGSVADLKAAFDKNGIRVTYYAMHMLAKTLLATKVETVDLIMVTVDRLGFPNGATTEEIYARARKLGLKLCPAEVGPALRLAYPDQPENEWLEIAMEPIAGPNGHPSAFLVEHNAGGLWLYSSWAGTDGRWYPERKFVFRLRPASSGASK